MGSGIVRDESTRVYLHTSFTVGSTGEGFQSLAKTAGESFQICSWIGQHWFCPRQDPCREANTAIGVLVVVVSSRVVGFGRTVSFTQKIATKSRIEKRNPSTLGTITRSAPPRPPHLPVELVAALEQECLVGAVLARDEAPGNAPPPVTRQRKVQISEGAFRTPVRWEKAEVVSKRMAGSVHGVCTTCVRFF